MGRIVIDRGGDLRPRVFYRFDVPFADVRLVERPEADWIVASGTPNEDPGYVWLEDLPEDRDRVEIKDCKRNAEHVTHSYYNAISAGAFGGSRLSPFVPASNGLMTIVSPGLYTQLKQLGVKGARLDPINIDVNQSDLKEPKTWALQFIGRNARRIPKVVDGPNACPFCGKTEIICQACGYWNFCCTHCEQHMVIAEYARSGPDDKRVPYERGLHRILEGSRWDGSDLLQGSGCNYASKRFIDWLLRIHAFPFYAEPVWFCVDGMNAQQKRWLDELQKPLEAR